MSTEDLYFIEPSVLDFINQPELLEIPLVEQARLTAQQQIRKYYPEYKQLNILMEGNQIEIEKMRNFINAVRAASNVEQPDLDAIKQITP